MAPKTEETTQYRGVRAFWSGTISFGLVSIPVNLFPANRSRSASLRMLDASGTPVRRRYYCPNDERDVHPEHILRGYELETGEYVVVTDDELEAVEPRKSRDIDLRRFVPKAEVPPIWFERGYYLTPSGESTKAYRLLAEVMERTQRVGIATFVMRTKEYLVAILAEQGILRAETLRFQDEIRSPEDVGLPEKGKVSSQVVARFTEAMENLAAEELDRSELEDDYAERLKSLAERKHKEGEGVVEPAQSTHSEEDVDDEEEEEVNLLETIRRSLQAGQGKRSSNGHARRRKAEAREERERLGRSRRPSDAARADRVSKESLYERAKDLNIPGRSQMNKQQLEQAIRKHKG